MSRPQSNLQRPRRILPQHARPTLPPTAPVPADAPPASPQRIPIVGIAAATLCAGLVLLLLTRSLAPSPSVAAQPPGVAAPIVVTVVAPTAALTPTPTCRSAEGQLTIIEAKEAAGNFSGASADAEAALHISG